VEYVNQVSSSLLSRINISKESRFRSRFNVAIYFRRLSKGLSQVMAQHLTESDFSYLLNIQSEVPNSGNYNDIIVTCH
jgi:hypothetical protein